MVRFIFVLIALGVTFSPLRASDLQNVVMLLKAGQYDNVINNCDSLLNQDKHKREWHHFLARKADAYYYLGDIQRSLEFYLLALDDQYIFLPENALALCENLSYAGFCYRELGHDLQAEQYFEKALSRASLIQDSVEMGIAHYNISTVLMRQGKLDEAMNSLREAYNIDIARRDTAAIGFDLKAMGEAFYNIGDPERAIPMFRESIDLLKKSKGNRNSLGVRYYGLSKAFLSLKQYDSAMSYIQLSITEHEMLHDSINLAERWVSLAMIYNELGDFESAIDWAKRAKQFLALQSMVVREFWSMKG